MDVRRVTRNVGIVLAASAAGAGVALLFAPQEGARTRRLIKRKAEDVGYQVQGAYNWIKERGNGAGLRLAK